jgi:hypothetical protein
MSKTNPYNTLEIPGSFLIPGFSLYVLEIIKESKKWFYIGMTGDPHYPSARAAFHRISGHLELAKHSTQNQLRIALKEKLGIVNDADLAELTIKMHHFPIEGFKKITDHILDNETVQQLKKTEEYKNYKSIQNKVLLLENALIFKLKGKLLNKTVGIECIPDQIPFPSLYNNIIKLVNNE